MYGEGGKAIGRKFTDKWRRIKLALCLGPGVLPLHRHPVKKWYLLGYGATSLLLLIGALLQYGFCFEAALGRFGAVIVVVGIFFTWKDVRSRFFRVEKAVQELLDQPDSNLKYTPKLGERRGRQMLDMEASIITIGTLTWAFGDLFWPYYVAIVLIVIFAFQLTDQAVDGRH